MSNGLLTNTSRADDGSQIDVKMHWGPLFVLGVVSALGVAGNLLLILAVILSRRLRVRGHALIVNLAVADLVVVAFIMPSGLYASQQSRYPFGQNFCSSSAFVLMCTCGVSTTTLMMIAIERYFHICRPNAYRQFFSLPLLALYILLIWAYSAAWTVHGFTGLTEYRFFSKTYLCLFTIENRILYAICLALFGMFVPILVSIVCYVLIFRRVAANRSGRGLVLEYTSRRQSRLIVTLCVVVIVFVVCWLPVGLIISFRRRLGLPSWLYVFFTWLALSNSSLNVVIYGLMNTNFRSGYRYAFRKMRCLSHVTVSDDAISNSREPRQPASRPSSGWNEKPLPPEGPRRPCSEITDMTTL